MVGWWGDLQRQTDPWHFSISLSLTVIKQLHKAYMDVLYIVSLKCPHSTINCQCKALHSCLHIEKLNQLKLSTVTEGTEKEKNKEKCFFPKTTLIVHVGEGLRKNRLILLRFTWSLKQH